MIAIYIYYFTYLYQLYWIVANQGWIEDSFWNRFNEQTLRRWTQESEFQRFKFFIFIVTPGKKTRKNKTKKSGGEVYWMGHPEVVTTVDGFTTPFEK